MNDALDKWFEIVGDYQKSNQPVYISIAREWLLGNMEDSVARIKLREEWDNMGLYYWAEKVCDQEGGA